MDSSYDGGGSIISQGGFCVISKSASVSPHLLCAGDLKTKSCDSDQ